MATEKIEGGALSAIARSKSAAKAQREDLQKRYGGVVTAEQVGTLLGISASSVEARRVRRELLALNVDEGFLYPVCQLSDGEILKGLSSVLSILYGDDEHVDGWLAFQFLVNNDAFIESHLQGVASTPLQALKLGHTNAVEKAASSAFEHVAR